MHEDDAVVVRTFADAFSAWAAHALLDAHDIASVVIGDDAGGMQPSLTYVHGVRLVVRRADVLRANAALEAADREAPPDATTG